MLSKNVYKVSCQGETHRISVDEDGGICLLDHPEDEDEVLHVMGIEDITCYEIAGRLADDPNALLDESIRFGDLPLARLALAAGADVHYCGDKAIIWAAIRGDPEATQLLIDAGADVNTHDGAPLRQAAHGGHIVTLSVLVDNGADSSVLENS